MSLQCILKMKRKKWQKFVRYKAANQTLEVIKTFLFLGKMKRNSLFKEKNAWDWPFFKGGVADVVFKLGGGGP